MYTYIYIYICIIIKSSLDRRPGGRRPGLEQYVKANVMSNVIVIVMSKYYYYYHYYYHYYYCDCDCVLL